MVSGIGDGLEGVESNHDDSGGIKSLGPVNVGVADSGLGDICFGRFDEGLAKEGFGFSQGGLGEVPVEMQNQDILWGAESLFLPLGQNYFDGGLGLCLGAELFDNIRTFGKGSGEGNPGDKGAGALGLQGEEILVNLAGIAERAGETKESRLRERACDRDGIESAAGPERRALSEIIGEGYG
jgi:hypothetical protein